MFRILLALIALPLAAQMRQNAIELIPATNNSASGYLDFKDLRPSAYRVRLLGPTGLTANIDHILPGVAPTTGQCLKAGTAGQWEFGACGDNTLHQMTDTDWSRVISDDLTTPGTYTITLTPAPLGVDAAITDSEFRLIGGPGAEEIVTSTGTGTCDGTEQASCTIEIVTTVAHGPGWTIKSSTYGLQEAWNANRTNLWCPDGLYYFYGTAKTGTQNTTLSGTPNCSLAPGKNDLTLIWANSTNAMRIYGIAIVPAGYTGLTGFKLGIVGTSNGNSEFHGIRVSGGEYGIDGRRSHEVKVKDSFFTQTTTGGTAILLGNIIHGDYWAGWITRNTFNGPWEYGVYDRGSGISLQGNGFNGPRIHFNFENWTALVNTSGTAVTWVSGDKFDTSWPGFVEINGGIYTISSVNSDTSITLAASAGTQTGVQLRHGATGSVEVQGNSIESGTVNEIGVNIDGTNPFYSVRIIGQRGNNLYNPTSFSMVRVNMPNLNELVMNDNNFSNSVAGSSAIGFEVLSSGDAVIAGNVLQNYAQPITLTDSASADSIWTITGNKLQCEAAATSVGITVDGGEFNATGNSFQNCDTGVDVQGTTAYQISGSKFIGETDRYLFGVSVSGAVIDRVPVLYAKLPANAGSGSTFMCSDCKPTASDNRTCTSGGTGAVATRIGAIWKCDDGLVSSFVQGGNTFATTALLGTNDSYGLGFQTGGSVKWSIGTTGHLTTGSSGVYDIGAGIGSNSPRTVYADTSVVTPRIGRNSSASLTVMTDSADRWIFNSAGMMYPATDDTYDAGLTGTRIRGVYAKFGEFYKSGSTSASDYVETRNYKFKDATGSSGSWDMKADVTATVSQLFSRDNVGDPFRYSIRQSSGSPVNYELLYADLVPARRETALGHTVTDTNLPKLGRSTVPWHEIWGTTGDFAGDLTIHGTTVAAGINYTGGYMTGTMRPLFSGTGKIGDTSYPYGNGYFSALDVTASGFTLAASTTVGYVWTATSTAGAGQWQVLNAATILPVVDTQTIIKGSSDATKLLRFEVDGFTTATTRVLTPPNANATIAGLEVTQTFVNPQTISIASVQNQLTLAQPNPTGTWDPACVVLASSDTVTSATYGAARLCAGYESASFADELFAIQTATGSGIYQNALTIKNQVVTVAGDLVATAGTFSFNSGTMDGTMKPLFSGNGSIGAALYRYGAGYFSTANITASGFTLADTTTIGYCWTATSTAGAGSWQACGGSSQWTTSGSDIYRSTGLVWIGSSSNNISAKLQVENSASVNLLQLKYTGATATNSGGGIIAHQGSAPSAADHRLGFIVFGSEISGTQYNRVAVQAFSSQSWSLGSAEGAYLQFSTTSSSSTTRTARWRFAHDGHLLSESDGSYDIGATGANRVRNMFLTGGITAAGNFDFQTATLSGSLVMGSTTVLNSSRNAVGINAFSQSITFSAGSTYNVGSTGAPPLNVYGNYIEPRTELVLGSGVYVRGDLTPAVNLTYALGDSTHKWTAAYINNAFFYNNIQAPNGSNGQSTTITVRDSAGTGTCTIIFSGGLKTGGTC